MPLMGVMYSVCIFVFIVGLVYVCGYCIRKITMLLVRSDDSVGFRTVKKAKEPQATFPSLVGRMRLAFPL